MNENEHHQVMKRRTVIGLLASVPALLLAGAGALPGLIRRKTAHRELASKVSVQANPLAVPRTLKGTKANG
jgi:hypothetical protein